VGHGPYPVGCRNQLSLFVLLILLALSWEHIICRHLRKHLEDNNILTTLNHGFRSGYSCESQLIVTMDDLLQAYDKNTQVDCAILDFSKAFDTVLYLP
jgi:hypothetical protein